MFELETAEPPDGLEMTENVLLDEMVCCDVIFGRIQPPEELEIEYYVY